MSILIFIVVIVALIVVHEFGHFIAAKLSGMRVDEFGIGYPPRALTITTVGETKYTLNWLPFGGFVKIFGEDGEAGVRSFTSRPRLIQAVVLVAGVAMNLLFAYVLITGALVAGTPRVLDQSEITRAKNLELAVSEVLPGSPAEQAGLLAGDTILKATEGAAAWESSDPKTFSQFVSGGNGSEIVLAVMRNGKEETHTAMPVQGLVSSDPTRYALGVDVVTVGVLPLSLGTALTQGAQITWSATILTAQGLAHFFYGILTFSANLSQVAGPVGIASVVGNASSHGIGDLFSIMAIISINLAIINLIPIPALDGGRLLFVIIEGIIRRPIAPRVAQTVNLVGFVFLILLMVIVTAHDVFKIIS